jgi:hypothetical protein
MNAIQKLKAAEEAVMQYNNITVASTYVGEVM